jgi:hypothetical protein
MRKSEVLLALALLASAATALWLWNELCAERELNAALVARVDAQPAPPIAAPEPLSVSPAQSAPAPAVPTPVSSNAVIANAPNVVHGTEEEWQTYQRRLMQNPKYREAWRQQERLKYGPRRENLMRLLGLTAEQADAVIDLGIDRNIGWIENPPSTPEQEETNERDHQARLGALLGEPKRAQLQEYMESRGTRMQVDRFRTQLSGVDTLRDDQVEPLIAALNVEDTKMRQSISEFRDSRARDGNSGDWQEFSERQIEEMKAAHGRMHAAASPILSSSQLEKLDAMLKRDLERTEAEHRVTRLQVGKQAAKID